MNNIEIIVEGNRTEKTKFGNIETAVEYIRHRLNENFTIIVKTNSKKDQIIQTIRQSCQNILKIS